MGYFLDDIYVSSFHEKQSSAWASFRLALDGIAHRPFRTALDLGCGLGTTAILDSLVTDCVWDGIDLNPDQVFRASRYGAALDLESSFLLGQFEDVIASGKQYDYIAAHGILTWVSDASRLQLFQVIKKLLRPGGVVFLSQNTPFGWSHLQPVRELFYLLHREKPAISLTEKLNEVQSFVEGSAAFVRRYPEVVEKIEGIKKTSAKYIPHEYLNDIWDLLSFNDVESYARHASLSFLGSAELSYSIPSLTEKITADLGLSKNAQEDFLDAFTLRSFRSDFWVLGTGRLTNIEWARGLFNYEFFLGENPKLTKKFQTVFGTIEVRADLYDPYFNQLKTAGSLDHDFLLGQINSSGIRVVTEILKVLILTGDLQWKLQSNKDERIEATNKILVDSWHLSSDSNYLISRKTHRPEKVDPLEILTYLENTKNDQPEIALADRVANRIMKYGMTLFRGPDEQKLPVNELVARRLKTFSKERASFANYHGLESAFVE
ncbi:class I SAM-dependent methyltransferase [Litoricolaceae bacterium]|nr:class I SAM-dependent methyltransferase [Litorivicinaceae bacterium]